LHAERARELNDAKPGTDNTAIESTHIPEVADLFHAEMVEVTAGDAIPIPGRAVELVDWLGSGSSNPIECLGRFGESSGRIVQRMIGLRAQINTVKRNFRSLVQKQGASQRDILGLALLLATAWDIEISHDSDDNYQAVITRPEDAVRQGEHLYVFAAIPDTLEIYTLDDLRYRTGLDSPRFEHLLSKNSRLAEGS
jgi:hypothetical protein